MPTPVRNAVLLENMLVIGETIPLAKFFKASEKVNLPSLDLSKDTVFFAA